MRLPLAALPCEPPHRHPRLPLHLLLLTSVCPLSALQAPLLPGLLSALVVKLGVADDPAMVQCLLCVLAQLLHANQQQLLDCLAGMQLRWAAACCVPAPGAVPGAALAGWCRQQAGRAERGQQAIAC